MAMITSPSSSSILLSPSSSSTSVSGARLILRFQVWTARLCRYKIPLGQPRRPLKIRTITIYTFQLDTITKLIPMMLVGQKHLILLFIYTMVLNNILSSTWNPLLEKEIYMYHKRTRKDILHMTKYWQGYFQIQICLHISSVAFLPMPPPSQLLSLIRVSHLRPLQFGCLCPLFCSHHPPARANCIRKT